MLAAAACFLAGAGLRSVMPPDWALTFLLGNPQRLLYLPINRLLFWSGLGLAGYFVISSLVRLMLRDLGLK